MKPYSLAQVMRAIFSRDDVDHPLLVAIRRRAIQIGKTHKLHAADVALAMLSFMETGTAPGDMLYMAESAFVDRVRKIEERR